MRDIFTQLKIVFGKKQWKIFWLLMIAVFFEALFECVGLSLVLPAITVLMEPAFVQESVIGVWVSDIFNISDSQEFLVLVLVLIIFVFVLKNIYLLIVSYCQHRFILKCQFSLKERLLTGIFYSPYARSMNHTTPELVQIVETDADGTIILMETAMRLVSEILMIGCLCLLMFGVNYQVAFMVIALYGGLLLIFNFIIKPYFEKKSREYINTRKSFNKWLYQTVGNIKEIKAERKEELFIKNFNYYADLACQIDTKVKFLQTIPKSFFEICCIISLIGIIGMFMVNGMSVEQMIAQMSVFVLVAIRLLPSVLRLNQHLSKIFINRALLDRTASRIKEYSIYSKKENNADSYILKKEIRLDHVSFSYPESEERIFDDASMEIKAGQMVGISGMSGIGKTTLIDLIIGLLPVEKGQIEVDGNVISKANSSRASWCVDMAYIPQNVLLLNGTIRENVLFGSEDRGDEVIWDALERAFIADYVRGLPKGLETMVGEAGNKMSGGQRQRMAFARALYQKASFLILDETTSALDVESEEAVMHVVESIKGSCTIVMISHRQSALDYCDRLYTISNKKIVEITK